MKLAEMIQQENCSEEELYKSLASRMLLEITKQHSKKYVNLTLNPKICGLTDSKIGGVPYIPEGGEYPINPTNKRKLHILIQINFAQMPKLEKYPEAGLLQIFIDDEEGYGINWKDQQCQDSFRVLYYEDITHPMPYEKIKEIMPKITEDVYLPFENPGQEFELYFEEKIMPMTVSDSHFDGIFSRVWAGIIPDEWKEYKSYHSYPKEIRKLLNESLYCEGSRVGGYPEFTQEDPRNCADDIAEYELLLQIDSEGNDKDWYLMWGDSGIANFFINPLDLEKRDFSKVFYNWDCC